MNEGARHPFFSLATFITLVYFAIVFQEKINKKFCLTVCIIEKKSNVSVIQSLIWTQPPAQIHLDLSHDVLSELWPP